MTDVLQALIEALEQDRSLSEPGRLRQRIEALDRLEAYLLGGEAHSRDTQPAIEAELQRRAKALHARLEASNAELYRAIRHDIRQGAGPRSLLPWIPAATDRPAGEGYDYLDELIGGVLQFAEPTAGGHPLAPEMVFYQPTPARHIFELIDRAAFTAADVLIDLGSGLGHVPLLACLCADIRSIGIELEAAYVQSARQSAQALNLAKVSFVRQDVRAADLSAGTVFYLYTPFVGTILREVLDALRREAEHRQIRILSFGPCTPTVAGEPWLSTDEKTELDRIALFRSR